MLQLGCALSVNSCLAIVYDGLPHTIVFHQEFIIVLYFGAKKIVWGGGGWDGVGGHTHHVSHSVSQFRRLDPKSHLVPTGGNGGLFAF